MTNKWNCHFKKRPETITVGDPLLISCDGQTPLSLNGENLSIRFPNPEHKYKLHILKTTHLDPLSVELAVTSYRAGDFRESFFVTDGEREFLVEGLEFSVQTLLPKTPLSPHPPFGPWSAPLPLFYLTLWGFVLLFFLLICAFRIQGFRLRKKFLKKVESRRKPRPAKTFARSVRRYDEKQPNFIPLLETAFKLFLENSFFVPAESATPSEILGALKKYCPAVYEKYGDRLKQILNEFQYFRENKTGGEETAFQLKQTCFRLVFEMERGRL